MDENIEKPKSMQNSNNTNNKQNNNKNKKILICILVICTLFLGVAGGLFAYKNSTNKNNKSAEKKDIEVSGTDTLTKVEKDIAGINSKDKKDIEEDERTYSDTYKEYLKLPKEQKEKIEAIPRKQEIPFQKIEEIKKDLNEDEVEKEIPEKFNLADKINIEVRNQGMYGLCWDFASMKALETHLAINNLGNYDFSELHVDYIESDLMYGYRQLHQGGDFGIFKDYLIESGVVLEETVPYSYVDDGEDYNKFSDLKRVINVTETVDFPTMTKSEWSNYKNLTEEEINDFRNTVKKHIMKNGGLYACIATPDYGTKYFNGRTYAEYYTGEEALQFEGRGFHAVTIVGWDDNYSRENFNQDMRPEKDGAYIAVNSWGNWADSGYFYISYEDKYVESNLSGIVSTSLDDAIKFSSIKNDAIRDYLKEKYEPIFIDSDGEQYITKNMLSSVWNIDLSGKNMESLEGIEIFSNLGSLNISKNNITDLSPIKELDNLRYLDASNNKISDISNIDNIKSKNLWDINLSCNNLKDVSNIQNIIGRTDDDFLCASLNISENENVTGYETLSNISVLNISNCNIKDLGDLKLLDKLSSIDVSNNKDIQGLENLPKSLKYLNVSNCNFNDLSVFSDKKKLTTLDISSNNLTSLDGIENFSRLIDLTVSNNPIVDWSALKEIKIEENVFEEEFEDYYVEDYDENYKTYISITANNCNINSMSIFNDMYNNLVLQLKDNNITNVSDYTDNKIINIDLSNNKNITGLESLSNAGTVYLDNCNLDNLDDVIKLKNVQYLSLENNNITDITKLSELNNLGSLSLAGNKNINGKINSNVLYLLNMSNCNLDDNSDFSGLPELYFINISNNPKINNIYNIINSMKYQWITIIADKIEYEDYVNIKNIAEKNVYFQDTVINMRYEMQDSDNIINLQDKKSLVKEIRRNIKYGRISLTNGHLNRNGYLINIDNIEKGEIGLKIVNYYLINFNNQTNESDLEENTTNKDIDPNINDNEEINDVSDYIGVWQYFDKLPDIPESELTINKIDSELINFDYDIYRIAGYENINAYIIDHVATFEINNEYVNIKGNITFEDNSVILNITESTSTFINPGTTVFNTKSNISILK